VDIGSDDFEETDKINVVPLADLSLVLLIILMVLSPMVMSSMIRIQAPSLDKTKASAAKAKTPDPLFIKVTSKGLFLNNNPVESEEFLAEQIGIKLQDNPDRPVIVAADDNIQVGEVVHLLDLAKQNGANNISLLKEVSLEFARDADRRAADRRCEHRAGHRLVFGAPYYLNGDVSSFRNG
jgi:biopolymer transport protein ExbD